MERSCGILLHLSSLPSPYGIGTMGRAAYNFVDFLTAAGQSLWQLLPLGPTSCGDSPYQSFSSFAGNPYFIDLDMLVEDGLLLKSELDGIDWGENPEFVDYGKIYENRFKVLKIAAERGIERDKAELERFVSDNRSWLPDYALFMALKRHFGMKAWFDWPDEEARLHKPEAVGKYAELLHEDVRFFEYNQFLFFKQWDALHKYAKAHGVKIIGDMPIYVAMDSADVWASPEFFLLDEKNVPVEVAGVPPDYFSEDGQLWGNPLYDYDAMRRDGYGWWIRRVDGASKLCDILRIDHFRGFESFWAVPFDAETAKVGRWVKGPGMDLVGRLTSWFSELGFIAEDLGLLTPEVHELLEQSGLPGMKVLEFAFDPKEPSNYLPHRYTQNCVCYVGTHDNAPIMAWRDEADAAEVEFAERYLAIGDAEGFNWGMIRGGMSSVASMFIAQMQDFLALGADARMNTPGTQFGNWRWRLKPNELTSELAAKLLDMAKMYGRYPAE